MKALSPTMEKLLTLLDALGGNARADQISAGGFTLGHTLQALTERELIGYDTNDGVYRLTGKGKDLVDRAKPVTSDLKTGDRITFQLGYGRELGIVRECHDWGVWVSLPGTSSSVSISWGELTNGRAVRLP